MSGFDIISVRSTASGAKGDLGLCKLCHGEEFIGRHLCDRCHGTGTDPSHRCIPGQSHIYPHTCKARAW